MAGITFSPLFAANGAGAGSSDAASHRTLVVYFSQTGEQYGVGVITKGNTEIIAEMIAAQTKADLFHVETVASYPFEYKAQTDVAMKELRAKARPAIKGDVKDFDSYDTVYIGYPIWWGDLPMAMYTFIEKHDWNGRRVIPFCTHAGSGLAGTPVKVRAACKGATVLEGLAVEGTTAQLAAKLPAQLAAKPPAQLAAKLPAQNDRPAAEKEVTAWLKKIGKEE